MKRVAAFTAIATVFGALLFLSQPSPAIQHRYVEDFTTTRYKDTLNTTAWWDTVAGELKAQPFVPTLLGTCDTPGNAERVAVSGFHVFVADGPSGLQVMSGGGMVLVGSYNTPGLAWDVAVSGDYAFVADATSGLQVIDVSNPAVPALLGSYDTPGIASGVAVSGDHVFVADGTSGLQVIDVSDPANPTLLGTCDTPSSALDVDVSGDRAYVADGYSGLQVIDVGDPANPVFVGYCDTPGIARGVAVSGDHAYVADGSYGLQVIDISDPTNPVLVGSCSTPGEAWSVAVSGDNAYAADGDSGLQVIDISDPTNPTLEKACDTSGSAYGVAVSGDRAFIADQGSGLQVINIAIIAYPPLLLGTCAIPTISVSVKVSGDRAYLADGSSGLIVMDISDPANPSVEGSYDTPGSATGVAISGDHAFVADYASGLQVVDISDPSNPTFAGSCSTTGNALRIAVSGDYAFIAEESSGLEVIDISDPANPTHAGAYVLPGSTSSVDVSGDYAFVTYGASLRVIDIGDPTNPTLAGSFELPAVAYGVAVSGNLALVAAAGLQVIDITDPTNPVDAGYYYELGFNARDVSVSGGYAFVADPHNGLQVFGLYGSLNLIATCMTPSGPRGVAVSGDHAFVVTESSYRFLAIQVFQSDIEFGEARSLAVDSADHTILRARLVSTQTDSVEWELATSGSYWRGIAPDGSWFKFDDQGSDLRWKSYHLWAAPAINPTVSQLEIDWLYEAACVDSIIDVPNDQGGWVRVHFTRSGFDFADEADLPVLYYGIWQRVEDPALIATLIAAPPTELGKSSVPEASSSITLPVIAYRGSVYLQSRSVMAASSFPAGTWEWVGTVPAVQEGEYIARVSTAADSSGTGTNHAVYVITAHTTTPSVWYASEPDSGYSVDNIAPEAPTGFAVAYNTGSGNSLSWDQSPDEDLHCFNVYRSSDPDFAPSLSTLVRSTVETSWSDPDYDGWSVYYKITAVDYVGNESDPASPGTVTAAPEPMMPQAYRLYPNTPNPFNPSTSIHYDVPLGGGAVALRVYDVSGRLVRTLVDGPQTAGQKTAIWNGKDDRGRGVSSGVYFYRLEAPGYKKTLKMVLIQ